MKSRISWLAGSLLVGVYLTGSLCVGEATAQVVCDAARSVCKHSVTYPVYNGLYYFQAGVQYVVKTEDLQQLAGQTVVPDTILWVAKWSSNNAYGAAAGDLVAVNDDCPGAGRASCVTFTPAQSFVGLILVGGYTPAAAAPSYGTCDVVVYPGIQRPVRTQDVWFGGWNMGNQSVKTGDALFVGAHGTALDWYDNQMILFSSSSTNCTGNCGTFSACIGASGCRIAGMARLTPSSSVTAARLLVGAALQGTHVPTRFVHSRLGTGWIGAAYADPDGDYLTWEVETQLGTCDSATGPGPDCSTTSGRRLAGRPGFVAYDSDGDGLGDANEVFGVRSNCDGTFAEPFRDPGDCYDATFEWTGTTGYDVFDLPLSALDGPDPREYDSYVECDGHADSGVVGDFDHFLSQFQKLWVTYVYEVEGLECLQNTSMDPASCPTELADYYKVSLHIYDDDVLPHGLPRGLGVDVGRAAFNYYFTPSRKYTAVFRYAVGIHADSGQSIQSGRLLVPGLDEPSMDYWPGHVFAHELGHALGIPGDGYSPNRPSLMTYGHVNFGLPTKGPLTGSFWSASVAGSCLTNADCSPNFVCSGHACRATCLVDADCAAPGVCVGGVCDVECLRENARFSRGLEGSLDEAAISETGYLARQVAQMACYETMKGATFDFACGAGLNGCGIDWSRNAVFQGGPLAIDIDDSTSISTHNDYSDWLRIYMHGRSGLNTMFQHDIMAIATNMEADIGGLVDYSGCDPSVTLTGGAALVPAPNQWRFDQVAQFNGPGTADGVTFGTTPCMQTIGSTVDGKTRLGFRFDAYFRLASTPEDSGAAFFTLVDSNILRVRIYANNYLLEASVLPGGTPVQLEAQGPVLPNLWYWVAVRWNAGAQKAKLYLIPNGNIGCAPGAECWNYAGGECVCAVNAGGGPQFTAGDLVLGRSSTNILSTLDGYMDEVFLRNWSESAWLEPARITCPAGCNDAD